MTPLAHPTRLTTVDSDFGGTLWSRQVRLVGPDDFFTGSYLALMPRSQSEDPLAPVNPCAPAVRPVNAFFATPNASWVAVRKKAVAQSGIVTAATLTHVTFAKQQQFYANPPLRTVAYWWAGQTLAEFPVVEVRDQRLQPFFERLDQIEAGNWDLDRGRAPSAEALQNARSVLRRLTGGSLIPKKLAASDGRIVLYFTTGQKYSNVEVLSNGGMVLVNSDGVTVPEVDSFRVQTLPRVIARICAHLT